MPGRYATSKAAIKGRQPSSYINYRVGDHIMLLSHFLLDHVARACRIAAPQLQFTDDCWYDQVLSLLSFVSLQPSTTSDVDINFSSRDTQDLSHLRNVVARLNTLPLHLYVKSCSIRSK